MPMLWWKPVMPGRLEFGEALDGPERLVEKLGIEIELQRREHVDDQGVAHQLHRARRVAAVRRGGEGKIAAVDHREGDGAGGEPADQTSAPVGCELMHWPALTGTAR